MPQPLRLEIFEIPQAPDSPALLMPEEIEDLRLNAYERGYVAGWDDGGKQTDADESTRRAAIERQIEQLSFTYHEARGHLLKAIEPLIVAIVGCVVPMAARVSVVPLAIEHLMPLAHAAAESPITLRIGIGDRGRYEAAFAGLILPPIDLVESDAMAPGQAEFTFGALDTRIDLTQAAEAIGRAVTSFYQINTEERHHA